MKKFLTLFFCLFAGLAVAGENTLTVTFEVAPSEEDAWRADNRKNIQLKRLSDRVLIPGRPKGFALVDNQSITNTTQTLTLREPGTYQLLVNGKNVGSFEYNGSNDHSITLNYDGSGVKVTSYGDLRSISDEELAKLRKATSPTAEPVTASESTSTDRVLASNSGSARASAGAGVPAPAPSPSSVTAPERSLTLHAETEKEFKEGWTIHIKVKRGEETSFEQVWGDPEDLKIPTEALRGTDVKIMYLEEGHPYWKHIDASPSATKMKFELRASPVGWFEVKKISFS